MEKLNLIEIEEKLEQLEGWEYIDGAIETSFQFENFKEAFLKHKLMSVKN